jgi:hypothetical protein
VPVFSAVVPDGEVAPEPESVEVAPPEPEFAPDPLPDGVALALCDVPADGLPGTSTECPPPHPPTASAKTALADNITNFKP